VSAIEALFEGKPVAAVELYFDDLDLTSHLREHEASQVSGALRMRQLEFAAGRWCARHALARLELKVEELVNGPDRAPQWPDGVVGSISHCAKPRARAVAVVARSGPIGGVGVDIEDASPLQSDIFDRVVSAVERRRLTTVDTATRMRTGKLIFSAKESYYKSVYPSVKRLVDFDEVDIEFDHSKTRFLVCPHSTSLPQCEGRYLYDGGHLLTGVLLESDKLPR
jgi:4'-phosphopantetheinyl transferase EntD